MEDGQWIKNYKSICKFFNAVYLGLFKKVFTIICWNKCYTMDKEN